jgi:addiction module HigA family antidote
LDNLAASRASRITLYVIKWYRSRESAARRVHQEEQRFMSKGAMQPLHPGEVLQKDFLEPAGLSETALARALGLNAPRINDLVRKRRGVSPDTALRLARYFGGDPLDWLILQAKHDLHIATVAAAKEIEGVVTPRAKARPTAPR